MREADEVREYTERRTRRAPAEGFGSLADKLRDALVARRGGSSDPPLA